MSVKNLGIMLLSSVLTFGLAPIAVAQSAESKDAGKASTSKNKQDNTAYRSDTGHKSSTTEQRSTEEVRRIQTALKDAGFDPGPIDGILGSRTTRAIRSFQFDTGTLATGKLNDETLTTLGIGAVPAELARRVEPLESSIPSELARVEEEPAPELPNEANEEAFIRDNLGISAENNISNREDVREIQIALTELAYNPGEANGMMTSDTQQAVREFQLLNGLPVTGRVDQQTKLAIDAAMHGGSPYPSYELTQRQKPGEPAPLMSEAHPQAKKDPTYSTTPGRTDTKSSTTTQTQHDTHADVKTTTSGKADKDAAERVEKSVEVLNSLTGTPDKRIPNELLERAEAIAVIPNMIKGAFGIGGRYGKGVVSQRLSNGHWSTPAFLEIGGGSFGAQIGVSSTDLVLVFTDAKALDLLMGGKDLKLGVDASVAAGPVGRSAEAGVNANLKSGVYAYSRSKGLFAGVALDGAVLDMDNSVNHKVYGENVDARSVLGSKVSPNATVRPFVDALERVVPRKKIS